MQIEIEGRKPTIKKDDKQYIVARITRPWVYFHEPTSWFFVDEVGWLPLLSEISITPGANGVSADSTGRVDYSNPIAKLENRGIQVIRPYDKRLADDYRPYYLEYDCVEGSGGRGKIGVHHRSVFESAVKIGRRTIWNRDDELWHNFLQHLIDVGLVEPMSEEVLALQLEVQQKRIDRAARQATNPYFAQKMEMETARRERMQKCFEEQFGTVGVPVAGTKPTASDDDIVVVDDPTPVKGRKPRKSAK